MPITAAKSKIQTHKIVPTTPLKILFLNSFFILSLPANQKRERNDLHPCNHFTVFFFFFLNKVLDRFDRGHIL